LRISETSFVLSYKSSGLIISKKKIFLSFSLSETRIAISGHVFFLEQD